MGDDAEHIVEGLEAASGKALLEASAKGRDRLVVALAVKRKDGKKIEDRALAVGRRRLYVVKPGGKLETEAAIADLGDLASPHPHEVNFRLGKVAYSFATAEADRVVTALRTVHRQALPYGPPLRCTVDPASRLAELPAQGELVAGGFADTYTALCDAAGVAVRDDVLFYATVVVPASGAREWELSEFSALAPDELRPLLAALTHNPFFRAVHARGVKLGDKEVGMLAELAQASTNLQQLTLFNTGASKEALLGLAQALRANKGLALSELVLSGHALEDKAATELGTALAAQKAGLVRLDLSGAQLTKSGATGLWGPLIRGGAALSLSLTSLTVSGNRLEGEGSAALAQWLSRPNALTRLRLANSAANLDPVLGALLMGSAELVQLDLSGNRITRKEASQLVKLLQSSARLQELLLANTGVPVDALRELLKAIYSNAYLRDFSLSLASNKLGSVGANLVGMLMPEAGNLTALDVADNELEDEGVAILAEALQAAPATLRSLRLSRNFAERSPERPAALAALAAYLNADGCALTSLRLEGAPKQALGADVATLAFALARNSTLTTLDLSGNGAGDAGLFAVAKLLQANRRLTSLVLDDNAASLASLSALRSAMQRNQSVTHLPVPLNDLAALLKAQATPEARAALQEIIADVERAVARNSSQKGAAHATDKKEP